MLIRERDLEEWSNRCDNVCYPPANKAIRSSLCNGLYCSGNVRGLNPSTRYYLWVSNLEAWGPRFGGSKSNFTPFHSPFTPQKVDVVIVPMDWHFPTDNNNNNNDINDINKPNNPNPPSDNNIPIMDVRT